MWDERYGSVDMAYGTEPNDFLREHLGEVPLGKSLCLAEGEGRNGLFLAKAGHEVTGVAQSSVGLEKFQRIAQDAGVTVHTVVADLSEFKSGVDPKNWTPMKRTEKWVFGCQKDENIVTTSSEKQLR